MINKQTNKMNHTTYTVEQFNNGTLFAVIMNLIDGTHEICSSYYKTEKAANKMLMKVRVWAGYDPLTGEKMETVGKITTTETGCVDETGNEVTLNDKGTWIYK